MFFPDPDPTLFTSHHSRSVTETRQWRCCTQTERMGLLEYQAIPSLRGVAHDGVLCTFSNKSVPGGKCCDGPSVTYKITPCWVTLLLPARRVTMLHCNGNSVYIFLFWELRGLSPNFHTHVSVSDLYVPRICPHISSSRKGRPIVGIYNSLTDT